MSACVIAVVTPAGELFREHIALGSVAGVRLPVKELRARVASIWGKSPGWVRLLCGDFPSVLSDTDTIDLACIIPSSGIITITAILSISVDKLKLGSHGESADIINEFSCPVSFPPPEDISINMMPFVLGNKDSIPKRYQQYWPIIQTCVDSNNNLHPSAAMEIDGSVAYLTIHESQVEKDCTQRRPGIHCESPGCNHALGGGEMLRWGFCRDGKPVSRSGGIFMCSNVSNSCRVWNVKIEEAEAWTIGELGNLEHFRDVLESEHSFTPQAGQIVWMTDTTPHQSLPMKISSYRQYFRLVIGEVSAWYKEHSTPNELGFKPDAKTKIVLGDKFEDITFRGYLETGRSTSTGTLTSSPADFSSVQHVVLIQAEGYRCVRIFAEPKKGAALLKKVESYKQVQLLDELDDFKKIRCKDVEGWVGAKNCVDPIARVLQQSEGHPSVRVFDEPRQDSRMVGEIPNGEKVFLSAQHGNFYRVHWSCRKLQGWVGMKNVNHLEPSFA